MQDPLPALLMTRPESDSLAFVQKLTQAGCAFRAVISPLFKVVPAQSLPDVRGMRGLIFTSANGVLAWTALGGPVDLPVYTIGPATTLAARAAGFQAWRAGKDADDLVAHLLALGVEGPLLHAHGAHVRGDVAKRLTAGGVLTEPAMLYDQMALELNKEAQIALCGNRPVVVPLFSPRTARLLVKAHPVAPLLVAAMSEAVAFELSGLHIAELKVASRPDSAAMLDIVAGLLHMVEDREE